MGTYTVESGTNLRRVDPQLLDIVKNAIAAMPYDAIITSGAEGRTTDKGNHGPGYAIDVAFIDANGKVIGNKGTTGGVRAAPIYEQYAQLARAYQMATYPKLANTFRWGGGFQQGGTPFDYMHLDITPGRGGSMAYYSWDKGWTDAAYRAMPGLKQVALAPFSQSNGALQISGPSTAVAQAPVPSTRPAMALDAITQALIDARKPAPIPTQQAAFVRTSAPLVASAKDGNSLIDTLSGVVKSATDTLGSLFPKAATPVADNKVALPIYPSAEPSQATAGYPVARSARPGGYSQDMNFQGAGANRLYADNVQIALPPAKYLADVRAALPGIDLMASNILDKQAVKDQKLIAFLGTKLPSYMGYDPASGTMTIKDARSKDVREAVDKPNENENIAKVLAPYIKEVQASREMPLPYPRSARPAASAVAAIEKAVPSSSNASPWDAFMSGYRAPTPAPKPAPQTASSWDAFMQPYKASPAVAPAPAPSPTVSTWGSMAAAKPVVAIPPTTASKITPVVSPWSAMAAAGPMGLPVAASAPASTYGVADPLSAVERGWAANPVKMAAASVPPASVPRPVAPPPVYNWTTSSWLPEAPVTPANRPGTTPKPETPTGLLGKFSPMSMLSGFLASAIKPTTAPRGQFGQPLAVGGTYRNGAVWAADGSGYGGSAGQSTAGLKPGERVYDTNTGEWGLKVGQPVTWTGSSAGNTSTATGTFKGTSTGTTYNVGQKYTAGGYTYQAMPDGTFKRL